MRRNSGSDRLADQAYAWFPNNYMGLTKSAIGEKALGWDLAKETRPGSPLIRASDSEATIPRSKGNEHREGATLKAPRQPINRASRLKQERRLWPRPRCTDNTGIRKVAFVSSCPSRLSNTLALRGSPLDPDRNAFVTGPNYDARTDGP